MALQQPLRPVSECTVFPEAGENSMALVLCTGVNRNLMTTRRMILEDAGHTVVTPMSEPGLTDACARHEFDVAVIGQGISDKEKLRLFSFIHQHCASVKVLELYPSY